MTHVEGKTYIRRGSVSIPNQTVYDDSISYAALGLLAIMLARPADAPQGYRAFLRPKVKVGQAGVLGPMEELRAAGYRRQFLRTTSGANRKAKVVTDTYISESPLSHDEYRQWHREATGKEPIELPDRKKSKATLATVSDAHSSDAHSSDAHTPDAQTKAFPASSKLRGENQGGADATERPGAPSEAKRAADADSPNGSIPQAPPAAADASSLERIHCLNCDRTEWRDLLNANGHCPACVSQARAEAQAREAAAAQPQDPAETARLAAEAKRASLERQAKRAGITVDELLASRQPRT